MVKIPCARVGATLHCAPDTILILDRFGTIWFVNHHLAALFGYEEGAFIGMSVERLLAKGRRTPGVENHDYSRQSMENSLVLWGRRRDGAEMRLNAHLTPVEGATGHLFAVTICEASISAATIHPIERYGLPSPDTSVLVLQHAASTRAK
jgi:PAS domain S-box-containing protein